MDCFIQLGAWSNCACSGCFFFNQSFCNASGLQKKQRKTLIFLYGEKEKPTLTSSIRFVFSFITRKSISKHFLQINQPGEGRGNWRTLPLKDPLCCQMYPLKAEIFLWEQIIYGVLICFDKIYHKLHSNELHRRINKEVYGRIGVFMLWAESRHTQAQLILEQAGPGWGIPGPNLFI